MKALKQKNIWFHLLNECYCFFSLIWRGGVWFDQCGSITRLLLVFFTDCNSSIPEPGWEISAEIKNKLLLCLNIPYLTSFLYFTGTSRPAGRYRTTWAHGSAWPSRTQRAFDSRRGCKSANSPFSDPQLFSPTRHKSQDVSAHRSRDYFAIYYEGNL